MKLQTWLRRLVLAAAAALAVALLFARWITDWLWFESLGYGPLFTLPLAWQGGLLAGTGLFTLGVLWANMAIARPALARAYLRLETLPRMSWTWTQLRRWVLAAAAAVSFLWGASVAGQWTTVALWLHRQPFGVKDPIFGQDVGFYVFDLPAYYLALQLVAAAAILSLGIAGLIYASAGLVAWRRETTFLQGRARGHLLILLAVLLALMAVSSWLGRYELLFSPSGVVFGATYTDTYIRLPVRTVTAILLAVTALLVAAAAVGRPARYAAAAGVLAVAVGVGGEMVAGAVYRLAVRPNELMRERPFIRHHIAMTRAAYGLDGAREQELQVEDTLTPESVRRAAALISEIRLWDWRPLGTAFEQLQVFRPYYDFLDVDVDRYRIDGRLRQVMLAARELNTERLQNPTWVNLRLQYTHGFGVVMSPASEVTPAGLPRLSVRDIPPRADPGWPAVTRPQIYVGQAPASWVAVDTRAGELDYPSGERNVFTRYQGRDGVSVGSWWNRLLFATRFRSLELLVSRELTPQSRILLYRSVMERIQRLVPYLRYDRDFYVVVRDNGTLVWIADGYTTSDRFPYSRPTPGWGNYVRNPVKVVVDAYDGTVDFYQVDPGEPLARAWNGVFGGRLFKPGSALPEDLRNHLRYPEELFTIQARILAVYHMTDPDVFYNQEDRWDMPTEIYGESEVPMQPYYAMADLGDGPEFTLLLPFTAAGRQNMVAWMVARMDPGRYGQLLLYRFPKQTLTYGPMQVEARINQDPDISRELTLWGQRGSRVLRGNLIVVPVGRTLLYVEPLFLVSEQSQLPELRRVVASTGPRLAMAPTLADALAALVGEGPAAPVPGAEAASPGPVQAPPAAGPGAARLDVQRALTQLEQARRRLEQGDWEGFGRMMQQLEATLRELSASQGGAGQGQAAPPKGGAATP